MEQASTQTELKPMGNKLSRILHLGYYLKQLDRMKFHKFLDYTSNKTGRGKDETLTDVLLSIFKCNISLLVYFQLRFFEKMTKI